MKDARAQGDAPNYDLLLNVSLAVSAELGRRSMRLGELLRVGPGAIVELDRRVDAPIDLLVNGRPVARGEIVAVDERYGVRITEVIARRGERA
jgi:flagellar motor switch protein FliN/FliY